MVTLFFSLSGIRRKVFTGAVIATCIFSFWTTYIIDSRDAHIVKNRLYQEALNSGRVSVIGNDVTTTTIKVIAQSYSHVTHTTDSSLQLNFSINSDISSYYNNKYVGFPEISGSDCTAAIQKQIRNNVFPEKVRRIFPAQVIADSNNCSTFKRNYGFRRYVEATQEELDFPIAFIILFYKDLDQVLFLLRALYHPHNVYCLNVDTKVNIEFLEAVKSVAKCLPNVFLASKLENIVYAGFTRLMADIDCMDDLLRHPVQWKYVFNMPGQQFPLRTNLEIVKILKIYNGSNDIEGITGDRMLSSRFKLKYNYVRNNDTGVVNIVKTEEKNSPPPHNLEIVKGSAYGTYSRDFVNFVVNDQVARDFLEWSKSVASPDEYFWATLQHSKSVRVPGGYTGEPDKKPWISAYASWGGKDPCATIRTRSICIFSPADLPMLMQRHELFANKFYITHHPAALHCLDQLLFNLTLSRTTRDLSYYQNLPFVLNRN